MIYLVVSFLLLCVKFLPTNSRKVICCHSLTTSARTGFILYLLPLSICSALECELYIAESTIPNAGIGIFSGAAKSTFDFVGNGDKAIPLVDLYFHNDYFLDGRADPLSDYVWAGADMGMASEGVVVYAFWPGIDAMVNCYSGLLNVDKATPVFNESGIHRSKHPGAGGVTPYDAAKSPVTRDIPIGGELFKNYSPEWFIGRPQLGNIPLLSNYYAMLDLLSYMMDLIDKKDGISPSTIFDELIREFKIIWDSRTLNAIHDFSWEDMKRAIDVDDVGILLQPNATKSIEWLNKNGKCIDHIVNGRSTVDGAGSGAFAKRDIPKDTIVTGTPLFVFPNIEWFNMYESYECPDGTFVRDMTQGPSGKQLVLNYCFGHPESTALLCPYGSGVNYINHNRTKANVKVQWARNGVTKHQDEFLHQQLTNNTKVALDYVATRDIAQGEEFFLDYGDVWEDEWNLHVETWKSQYDSSLEDYVSATEYNRHHGKKSLLTTDEQLLNPYPDNLSTRCHWLVGESKTVFSGNTSGLSEWHTWNGDDSGHQCDILGRNDKNESYWVKVVPGGNSPKDVLNVPREAIKFGDIPYTTDLHMDGAFRQPIGIPSGIFPDTWRNVIDADGEGCSAENPNCQAKDQFERLDDPCKISDEEIDKYFRNHTAANQEA